MVKPRVFVSHSHQDEAFTMRLVKDLRTRGADVWVDVVNIGAGDFLDRINEALARCEWVVLALTQSALDSTWVRQEINAAIRLKHLGRINDLMLIKAGPVDHKDVPPLWGVFNIFDATRDYGKAVTDVSRALGLPSAVPSPRAESDTVAPPVPAPTTPRSNPGRVRGPQTLGPSPRQPDDASRPTHIVAPAEIDEDSLAKGKSLVTQARAFMRENKFQKGKKTYADAISYLERATQVHPHNADAWTHLARAYNGAGRVPDGIAASARALELDSNLAYAWYARGYALDDQHVYNEALVAYDRALALDPNLTDAWNAKGNALFDLERYEEALAAYDRALALDPGYSMGRQNKSRLLHVLGRPDEAVQADRQARGQLDASPAIASSPHRVVGEPKPTAPPQTAPSKSKSTPGLIRDPRIHDAKAVSQDVHAALPRGAHSNETLRDLLSQGDTLVQQKMYGEATPILERATRIESRSFDAWAGLGMAYTGAGRPNDAVTAFDRALKLDGKEASVWNNKGAALHQLRRYDEALVTIERALTLDQNNADIWNNKGILLYGLTRYEEALACCDRALALDPKYADAWATKAAALRALGRTAEAEQAERRARELGWKG